MWWWMLLALAAAAGLVWCGVRIRAASARVDSILRGVPAHGRQEDVDRPARAAAETVREER